MNKQVEKKRFLDKNVLIFLKNTGKKTCLLIVLKSLIVWGKVCKDSTHHYFGVETEG